MSDMMISFGTRPSYIKLSPVWQAMQAKGMHTFVVCTGQHEELIRQHMSLLRMPVHHWCGVMRDSTDLNDTLSLVLTRVAKTLHAVRPKVLIVQGDTTSALGAALAGYHLGIPVAHVEAGLRSGHYAQPRPEEANRVAIDALSMQLFAPTHEAAGQARQTNPSGRIEITGNPVVDSVLAMTRRGLPVPPLQEPYILLDVHRRESFGRTMADMVGAVVETARAYGKRVIWPVHPNPAVQSVKHRCPWDELITLEPQPYDAFLGLMARAEVLITDSGGSVEEACSLGVPSLQLRDYTDRHEAIPVYSWRVGREPETIRKMVAEALAVSHGWREHLRTKHNPFGDGHAGERIAQHLADWIDRGASDAYADSARRRDGERGLSPADGPA